MLYIFIYIFLLFLESVHNMRINFMSILHKLIKAWKIGNKNTEILTANLFIEKAFKVRGITYTEITNKNIIRNS